MPDKYFYSRVEFEEDCRRAVIVLDDPYFQSVQYIYAIPQGGIPFGMTLSQLKGIPLMDCQEFALCREKVAKTQILVVDDVVDSGKTLSKYKGHPSLSIHLKPWASHQPSAYLHKTEDWIVYWWEGREERSIEDVVVRMLEYIGEDPNREGLKETPQRVIKSWGEIYAGYRNHPPILKTFREDSPSGLIIDKGYFFSTCEHHLLPFFGDFWFGYIPDPEGCYMGASKIGRLIDYYSARAQVQERICKQVVDHIEKEIQPLGCILLMSARHMCKEMRGLRKYNSPYEHIEARGIFLENQKGCKDEFIARIGSRI